MNPVRYWMQITIAANPKKMPQTAKQVMNTLIVNFIVCLIIGLFTLASHIAVVLLPVEIGVVVFPITLIVMLTMLASLFMRMRRVTAWRYKIAEKDKPPHLK